MLVVKKVDKTGMPCFFGYGKISKKDGIEKINEVLKIK
jgi:hypothetical protein